MIQISICYRFKRLTPLYASRIIQNVAVYLRHPCGIDKYATGPLGDLQPPNGLAGARKECAKVSLRPAELGLSCLGNSKLKYLSYM